MTNRKMKMIFLTFVWACLFIGINILPANAATTGTDVNGFTWQSDDGVTCSITGYTGSGLNITIPGSIDGLVVTSIGNNAFKEKTITSVMIPNSVTSIGGFCILLLFVPNERSHTG